MRNIMKIKNVVACIMLVAVLGLCGCESKTEYGPCIGIVDERNPNLEYRLSIQNTVIGVICSETIFVPVIVLANETFCPVGVKPVKIPLK